MASLKSKTLDRLKSLSADPKRSLGQNFLINEYVVEKIIKSLSNDKQKTLEIGPGLGALTDQLLENPNFQVIELDSIFSEYWQSQGVDVIEADALRFDWSTVSGDDIQIVSNLPYQISSSIVVKLSCGPDKITKMVYMFQKEVAQRITAEASTKEYGLLTVMAQNFWEIKKVTDVGMKDFHPAPKVNSRVLAFERKPFEAHGLEENSREKFLKFVKAAFQQRRKFMLKNIKTHLNDETKQKLIEYLKEWGFDEKVRAENLSPQQFLIVFKLVSTQ